MVSVKRLDFGYRSVINGNRWFFINSKGKIINQHIGKWESGNNGTKYLRFADGAALDKNHVFIIKEV